MCVCVPQFEVTRDVYSPREVNILVGRRNWLILASFHDFFCVIVKFLLFRCIICRNLNEVRLFFPFLRVFRLSFACFARVDKFHVFLILSTFFLLFYVTQPIAQNFDHHERNSNLIRYKIFSAQLIFFQLKLAIFILL